MKKNYYNKKWNYFSQHRLPKIDYGGVYIITDSGYPGLAGAKNIARKCKRVAPHTKTHIRRMPDNRYRVHIINRYSVKEIYDLADYMLPW